MHRFGFLLALVLAGCQPNRQMDSVAVNSTSADVVAKPTIDWSSIEVKTEKPEFMSAEENLFGKFFNDRIEFHIIDQPNVQIHNAKVKRITLYYIDSVLCRKKYELDRNIADELAIRYGSVSYRSLNSITDSLARNMGIVLISAKGKRFNPYLKKYRLKWTLDDKSIYFRHEDNASDTTNVYVEELDEYRQLYKSVQKELI